MATDGPSVPGTGRRILRSMPDPAATPQQRPACWQIRHFERIDSTNRYVLDEARTGGAAGLVAVADHQTAGRGRLGRAWVAEPGSSLLVSVLLRPDLPAARLFLPTAAAGRAAGRGRRPRAGGTAGRQWPDDR